jgi:hypothetical protein
MQLTGITVANTIIKVLELSLELVELVELAPPFITKDEKVIGIFPTIPLFSLL